MLSRKTLTAEHAEIETLCAQMIDLLEHADAPREALTTLRWKLNRKLLSHLAKEDLLLYPRLKKLPSRVAATASRFEQEIGDLGARYHAYWQSWPCAAMAGDWAGFAGDTRAIVAQIRHRMEIEERELYPLLDEAGGPQRTSASIAPCRM